AAVSCDGAASADGAASGAGVGALGVCAATPTSLLGVSAGVCGCGVATGGVAGTGFGMSCASAGRAARTRPAVVTDARRKRLMMISWEGQTTRGASLARAPHAVPTLGR